MNINLFKEREDRKSIANQLVELISSEGRRFFFHASSGRMGFFDVDTRGLVWWTDEYTQVRISTHDVRDERWRGFSHGGTLRSLVMTMSKYILTGEKLSLSWIAPSRRDGESNLWGYSVESASHLRQACCMLSIIKEDTLEIAA